MTSISSAGFSPQQFTSPRDLLQNELKSEVASGAVKSGDLDALSSALDSIDSSLRSAAGGDRAAGSKPPSPDEMKAKIDDLISGQVDAGTLTSDQADELKSVFANALPQGGPGGHGGPGGPGAGGPPGGGGSADAGGQCSNASNSTSDSNNSDLNDLLASFLKTLQEALSKNSNYGSNGATGLSITSLVLNYQA